MCSPPASCLVTLDIDCQRRHTALPPLRIGGPIWPSALMAHMGAKLPMSQLRV